MYNGSLAMLVQHVGITDDYSSSFVFSLTNGSFEKYFVISTDMLSVSLLCVVAIPQKKDKAEWEMSS